MLSPTLEIRTSTHANFSGCVTCSRGLSLKHATAGSDFSISAFATRQYIYVYILYRTKPFHPYSHIKVVKNARGKFFAGASWVYVRWRGKFQDTGSIFPKLLRRQFPEWRVAWVKGWTHWPRFPTESPIKVEQGPKPQTLEAGSNVNWMLPPPSDRCTSSHIRVRVRTLRVHLWCHH